ncbi:MAG: DUF2284 domain-containing protein [Bacillota bacterium]|nr:DUF2284 domain-containing protein [Bacillota bacterium]
MNSLEQLAIWAKEKGAHQAVVIDLEDLNFSPEVRRYCAMNHCGKYGRNWSCPPAVGEVSELEAKARSFSSGILLQTLHPIAGSFDWQGMMTAKKKHEQVLRKVYRHLLKEYRPEDALILSAGACELCKKHCTYTDGEPCRHPNLALSSLEAYGIDVVDLTKKYAVPYHYSDQTLAYVGLILARL